MAKSYTSEELSQMTNESLALLSQEGFDGAFDLLVARMLPVALSCASGYDNPPLCREDLVQEGMFGLISAVRTYSADKNASFKTYAGVCIKNRIASAARKSTQCGDNLSLNDEDFPDFDSNPADLLIKREKNQNLGRFIDEEFSDFEKEIIRLYLAGCSYKEIAQALSTRTKAVDNALQRIRRKLKGFA
ncbi:MAG: sigma-70 family RNA polymerase sigma factor [Clostridia bacterium]|nr:sigma-70 family RNA polymerase sigma factor [Clostridia bacterium]